MKLYIKGIQELFEAMNKYKWYSYLFRVSIGLGAFMLSIALPLWLLSDLIIAFIK